MKMSDDFLNKPQMWLKMGRYRKCIYSAIRPKSQDLTNTSTDYTQNGLVYVCTCPYKVI